MTTYGVTNDDKVGIIFTWGFQWYYSPAANWISHICSIVGRADSRLAPNQWETTLQSNAVLHWLRTSLESAQVGTCRGDPVVNPRLTQWPYLWDVPAHYTCRLINIPPCLVRHLPHNKCVWVGHTLLGHGSGNVGLLLETSLPDAKSNLNYFVKPCKYYDNVIFTPCCC